MNFKNSKLAGCLGIFILSLINLFSYKLALFINELSLFNYDGQTVYPEIGVLCTVISINFIYLTLCIIIFYKYIRDK
ncbi:hypothetical protein ACOAKC_12160 [Hathewaya histolytica]|uniref:hypothetical protein n=1 Tax=Hathewaya histolytica TaxID=1498 RepID=UPI003B677DBC